MVLEGLGRSGRLVGKMSSYFRPDPTWWHRVKTRKNETEIVLQNPNRVKGMIVFFFTVTLAQILLVLKKKQFEKVQAAEMNF